MKRSTLIALGWLWVVVVLAVVPLGRFAEYYFHAPAGQEEESVAVDIPAGASLNKVALLLQDKGVVDSPRLFTLSARLTGQDRKIRSGEYGLSPQLSPSDVLKALTESPPLLHPVTIAEGLTFAEVAQILNEAETGRFGNAAAYSVVLILIVLAAIGLLQLTVGSTTGAERV